MATAAPTLQAPAIVTVGEIVSDEASDAQKTRFLKLTGYKEADILAANKNGTFVTANGGKYRMDKPGKHVAIMAGPDYPKLKEHPEVGSLSPEEIEEAQTTSGPEADEEAAEKAAKNQEK